MFEEMIFINNLKIKTTIGCLDYEKIYPQSLILDLEIALPLIEAAQSDELKDTLNYVELVNFIKKFAENNSFNLLETFGYKLLENIFNNFTNITAIKLKLTKPQALVDTREVGIVIIQKNINNLIKE